MDIKIYTFGRFSLLKHNKPLRFTRKAQMKPLVMLKMLIAFGGRNVKKERLSDSLWPDSDGDVAENVFTTTLHRLRKLLGCADALQLNAGCLTLDPKHCWVDCWKFERICRRAEIAWENASSEAGVATAIDLSMQAMELYKGPFLNEEMTDWWTVLARERLRSKYLRAVGRLGHYWESTHNYEKAVTCFQKSLEVDGLDEEFYRRLIACYYRLGERGKALLTYRRCRKALITNLGVEPSEETEILRKTIEESS